MSEFLEKEEKDANRGVHVPVHAICTLKPTLVAKITLTVIANPPAFVVLAPDPVPSSASFPIGQPLRRRLLPQTVGSPLSSGRTDGRSHAAWERQSSGFRHGVRRCARRHRSLGAPLRFAPVRCLPTKAGGVDIQWLDGAGKDRQNGPSQIKLTAERWRRGRPIMN